MLGGDAWECARDVDAEAGLISPVYLGIPDDVVALVKRRRHASRCCGEDPVHRELLQRAEVGVRRVHRFIRFTLLPALSGVTSPVEVGEQERAAQCVDEVRVHERHRHLG